MFAWLSDGSVAGRWLIGSRGLEGLLQLGFHATRRLNFVFGLNG